MKSHSFFFGLLLCFALLTAVIGCTSTDGVVGPKNDAASELESATLHKVSPQAIWADCELFGTVGTPAHFKPGRGNFDELYNVGAVGGAFKDGAGAISESKPGDQDFNGGRWHVNVLRAGIDPYK